MFPICPIRGWLNFDVGHSDLGASGLNEPYYICHNTDVLNLIALQWSASKHCVVYNVCIYYIYIYNVCIYKYMYQKSPKGNGPMDDQMMEPANKSNHTQAVGQLTLAK